ncbi:hypothetical protein H6F89_06610 [Cyanobacteria bacterium FACHB-63]|nr:hypothetical protein [Cyanobacteria bacterium FACHB-63]
MLRLLIPHGASAILAGLPIAEVQQLQQQLNIPYKAKTKFRETQSSHRHTEQSAFSAIGNYTYTITVRLNAIALHSSYSRNIKGGRTKPKTKLLSLKQ